MACLEMVSLNEDLSHMFGPTTTFTEEFTCEMDEDAPSVLLDHISEDEENALALQDDGAVDGPNEAVDENEASELEIDKDLDDDTSQQAAAKRRMTSAAGRPVS